MTQFNLNNFIKKKKNTFKRYLFKFSTACLCAILYLNISQAQDKKLTSAESNQGLSNQNGSQKVTNTNKKVSTSQSNKIGNIKIKAPSQRYAFLKKSNSTNTSQHKSDATITVKSIYKQQKQIAKTSKAASSFRGKLVIGNKAAVMKNKAGQMAAFRGNTQIKMQKPKGSKTSWYTGQYMKPVVYNKGSLKKGSRISKSQMANYQKEGNKKLKYNTRESDWLQPDERKVPKGMIENKGK